MSARIVLVGGGARSGKSRFAQGMAERLGERRAFVATAQAFDDEMRARIDAHVAERGDAFVTVEEPLALPGALDELEGVDVALVDCLTLWLSNLLLAEKSVATIEREIETLCTVVRQRRFHVVLVTNEVGMGIVPETPLGRIFRDVAGRAHQRLAAVADEVYLAALGTVLRLKPGPVTLVAPTDEEEPR